MKVAVFSTKSYKREGNFSLSGLLGFDLHGKTVGIVGTGKIGAIAAQILKAFGCQLLAYDKFITLIVKRSACSTSHCQSY